MRCFALVTLVFNISSVTIMVSPRERKNPNMTDSLPTFNCVAVKHLLQLRRVSNFWNSIVSLHIFGRKPSKHSDITNPDSLPSLPFDLITEILSRLSVKLLLRFQCVCKSWNSLIYDHKFARKSDPNLHVISFDDLSRRFVLRSYPLQSLFTDLTTDFVQLGFPFNSPSEHGLHYIVGSCDGILCIADYHNLFVVLWNPSIRKFKELPSFEKSEVYGSAKFGFGYDRVSRNYKVVVLYNNYMADVNEDITNIKVYNFRTNSWRSIPTFHFSTYFGYDQSAVYVSGTINWLAYNKWSRPFFIVSFDLDKDSCQKIFTPEHGGIDTRSKLCVLRDCLCIISYYYDVWVMKEYGIKESWTKLFKVSNLPEQSLSSFLTKALYIFEDDRVLLVERWNKKLIVYDLKNDTFKVTAEFQTLPEICKESLISPCS